MKLSFIVPALSLFLAAQTFAQDKNCAVGVYCADEMVCVRTVSSPEPRSMHPSYYNSIISIKTFKSTRRDGALVDALVMSDNPVGTQTPSLKTAWKQAEFEYGNYGAPMQIKGNQVILFWGPTSNFSQGVRFKITSSRTRNGVRIDTLQGQEYVKGDVVGSYYSTYSCEAKVVSQLSRVDDFTISR